MANVTAEELAGLVPCAVEDVRRLASLGLVSPTEEGTYATPDVHLVRLMFAFEEAGLSLDDVARGVAGGALSFPPGLYLPEPSERSETYEGLASKLGRPPELLRRLSREVGLPPLSDDRIRADDAEMLSRIVTTLDLADDDDLSRFARLYGGTIQRLVSSALEYFDRTVRRRVATFDATDAEKDALTYERAGRFSQLASEVVPWLQRRHREHTVLDYLVGVTETFMEERGLTPPHPRQPPAIAFLDLTGYTALADEHGDEVAAAVASDLATVVQETATTRGGRPVKWLGDGVMFHFSDPGQAILGGLELVERTERAVSVPARIGINAGAVIAQEGDYFGRTVNVASRIADYAEPREVLVSDAARRSADVGGVEFELVGDVSLKGISQSVRLHRARRPG